MKKVFVIFSFCCVAAFASCIKSVDSPSPLEASDQLVFRAAGEGISTSVETKATAVTALSTFNVGCVTGTMGSSETEVWKAAFTSDGANPPTYAGGKYWPVSDPSYKFYASNVNLSSHAAGGYTVAATNATDVVCAVLASPTYKSKNTLTFEHIFARLGQVEVSAASGYTISGISITVTPKTGGTYDLFAGAGHTDGTGWSGTTSGSATSIANATPGTKSNDIYLVPGSYELTASWTATRGESVQTYTGKKQNVSLAAGKVTKITATLTGDASEILFGVSVTPWGSATENVEFPINAAPAATFGGLQISTGPLKYNGTSYEIASSWDVTSVNSVYGKADNSTFFSFIEMGQLFEKAGFTTSDGDIDNLLDPLDGWRLPTKTELEAIIGTSRVGATVNGSASKHFAFVKLSDSSPANRYGLLLFPDGKTITGQALNYMDTIGESESPLFTTITSAYLSVYVGQGCAFLPFSGGYVDGSWRSYQYGGLYWSSTEFDGNKAYYFFFNDDGDLLFDRSVNKTSNYYSIRLVHE